MASVPTGGVCASQGMSARQGVSVPALGGRPWPLCQPGVSVPPLRVTAGHRVASLSPHPHSLTLGGIRAGGFVPETQEAVNPGGSGADPVADAQFQPPRTISEGEARDLSPVCTTERVSSLLVVTQPHSCRSGTLTWLPAPVPAPVTRARHLSKLPREEQSSAPRTAEASRGWTASGTELAGLPGLGHPGRGWGRAGRLTDRLRPCSRLREAPAGICGLAGAGCRARLQSGRSHLDGGLQVVSPHFAAAPHLGPG